jgi:cytochrome c-type biogenesis protein CcmH
MKRLLLGTLLLCVMALAHAIDSQPPFPDPALQARYEALTHELRCLVCQDETVADSNAELAADFRRQIHDMVAAGKTDAEIKSYMVGRYGDFVLYKPPVQANTALLWMGPFILLLIALTVVSLVVRRRAGQPDEGSMP